MSIPPTTSHEPVYPNPTHGPLYGGPSEGVPDASGPQKRSKKSSLRSVLSTLLLVGSAFFIAFAFSFFVFQSYQVEGQSMETTLQNGDRLIVNKLPVTYSRATSKDFVPERGKIIVFEQNNSFDGGPRQLIKRVIGLPGDRVVIKDSIVTIFNTAHPQGYNPDTSGEYEVPATAKITAGQVDIKVDEAEVFVLGDNRANSADSRIFGPIDSSDIIGELSVRILPLGNAEFF